MERVCFIRPKGEPGPVLVMASDEPPRLLAILQAGNPSELELIGTVDGYLYPESWWHDQLSPWRLRGAWYEPKAQVLCRVEDALRGRLEAPERFDPILDPPEPFEGSEGPLERVPEEVRVSPEEQARRKWAFPELTPEEVYPPVEVRPVHPSKALPVLRKLLQSAA